MPKPTQIHNLGHAREPELGPQSQPTHERSGSSARQEGGSHYTQMQVQPWDVIDSWPIEQRVGFFRGNAVKYLMRMGSKDEQVQEAKKARHYIDKLIETLGG